VAAKQLGLIIGVMVAFLVCTGAAYYLAWHNVWTSFQGGPQIGAEPLKIKLVVITKDIPAGTQIDTVNADERYETVEHVAIDAYGFASECLGRKTKWPMKKGQFLARHDLLPEGM
jgi:hypothetical protein